MSLLVKFKDLTIEERVDIFKHHQLGGIVQFYDKSDEKWKDIRVAYFRSDGYYRKKPLVEKFKKPVFFYKDKSVVTFDVINNCIVRGTYTSPDCKRYLYISRRIYY